VNNLIYVIGNRCFIFLPHGAMLARYMPCVRLSQVGVLPKQLNVRSDKQHHTIAQGLSFSEAKNLREILPVSPPTGAPNASGVGENRRLSTNNWLYLENGTRLHTFSIKFE